MRVMARVEHADLIRALRGFALGLGLGILLMLVTRRNAQPVA